jgi:hypothetical protein
MNKTRTTLLIALSILLCIAGIWVMADSNITYDANAYQGTTVATISTTTTTTTTTTVATKSNEEIAKEVIAGKWGNGKVRRQKLTAAGYNYKLIQKEVDKLQPKTTTASYQNVEKVKLPKGRYPEAELIWNIMADWGWSPETRAGIIGNMMAEVGGHTLDLSNWDSNSSWGYGLIQWTGGRRSLIKSRYGEYPTIPEQMQFMKDELLGTNNTGKQVSDSTLDVILNKNNNQSPESIAYSFACNYERCATQYRSMRQGFARTAYNYFMSK